jgi:hypothetical protein
MLRSLTFTLLLVFLSGCAVQGEAGHFKPINGLGAAWTAFVVGLIGLLMPDTASRWVGWDDRSIMRLAGGALLSVSSIALADYYFNLNLVGLAKAL